MSQIKKYRLFAGNPEFSRNIWQELTPARLLVPPAVLGLIILLIMSTSTASSNTYRALLGVANAGFALVVILWGLRLSGDALMQEFTEGTWDSQRMSGLSPMQMLWGKLFGGTIAAWYAGMLLLMLFVYAALGLPGMTVAETIKGVLVMLLTAIVMHTICMSSLLAMWRKRGRTLARGMRGVAALPIVIIFIVLWILGRVSFFYSFFQGNALHESLGVCIWFGIAIEWPNMLLIMYACLAVWLLIGLWQQLRSELQFRNRPWWWLAFLLFWMVVLAGFVDPKWTFEGELGSPWHGYLLICVAATLATVYVQLFYERKDAMTWLHFFNAYQHKAKDKFCGLFPAWLTSFGLSVVLIVVLVIWLWATPATNFGVPVTGVGIGITIFLASLLLFVCRDIMLILWLNLSKNNGRADAAAILYLLVLYLLMPWLVETMVGGDAVYLFLPLVREQGFNTVSALYLLSPLIQSIVMAALLWTRWQSRKKNVLQ